MFQAVQGCTKLTSLARPSDRRKEIRMDLFRDGLTFLRKFLAKETIEEVLKPEDLGLIVNALLSAGINTGQATL